MTTQPKHKVLIIGAGFAGLMTAVRLSRKPNFDQMQVTVINATDDFVVRPRLHEWATNLTRERRKIADILNDTGVKFMHGYVTQLVPDHNAIVVTHDNEQLSLFYDTLIVALGSRVDTTAIKGITEYAYVLDAFAECGAEALRLRLLDYAQKSGYVVVIGGGATGIEGATHIKSLYPHLDVTIMTRDALGSFKQDKRVQREIKTAFAEQGITVHDHVSVAEITASGIMLDNGDTVTYDVCLWAGGFVAPTLGKSAGLQVNPQNQILIDRYQRALDYPNIVAIGDCAFPVEIPGNPYRMCCPVAMTMGAHAADNIGRLLASEMLQPLSFDYYGQGIQLGTNDAIGWLGYPDDAVHLMVTRGKPAMAIRNAILAGIDVIFDYEKRFGIYNWLGKKRYAKQQAQTTQSEQTLSGQSV